jgi:crossover junction endodeoxyribonuclease RuvC
MRVVGIDPGIGTTGIGVIDDAKGNQTLVSAQAILTTPNTPTPSRLVSLYDTLTEILIKTNPDAVAIEKLFFNTNTTTALVVGEARGVIELAAAKQNIPIFEYTPLEVKMSITGYGRADKPQMQSMVKSILKLTKTLRPDDVADAAAIALTHCFSYKMKQSLKHHK